MREFACHPSSVVWSPVPRALLAVLCTALAGATVAGCGSAEEPRATSEDAVVQLSKEEVLRFIESLKAARGTSEALKLKAALFLAVTDGASFIGLTQDLTGLLAQLAPITARLRDALRNPALPAGLRAGGVVDVPDAATVDAQLRALDELSVRIAEAQSSTAFVLASRADESTTKKFVEQIFSLTSRLDPVIAELERWVRDYGSDDTPATIADGDDAMTGFRHACARTKDGRVYCWGSNRAGALGRGTDTPEPEGPGWVTGLTRVAQVAMGEQFGCARTDAGEVLCWGDGRGGRLGDANGSTHTVATPRPVGIPPAKQIAVGRTHACALSSDGDVYCWGTGWAVPFEGANPPTKVSGLPPIVRVELGTEVTCVTTTAKEVLCWGRNDYGRLGRGTESGTERVPAKMLAVRPLQLALADSTTCALSDSGSVSCLGNGEWGGLGLGPRNMQRSLSFVEVPSLANVVQISGRGGPICARTKDGRVLCWGVGRDGFVGNGDWDRSVSIPAPVALSNVRHVSSNYAGTCARDANWDVHCWGAVADGILGFTNPERIGGKEFTYQPQKIPLPP